MALANPGRPQTTWLVSLDVSYHKEREHTWYRGGGAESERYLRYWILGL